MKENFYEGKYVDLWIEDGIMFALYKASTIDLETARFATKERLDFCKDKVYPVLVDYCYVKTTIKEARDYFSSKEANTNFSAMAILINSPIGKVMGNFYLFINKPPLPTEMFNNKEDAVSWLKTF